MVRLQMGSWGPDELRKITITPFGTCRIATPLKRGAARYPVTLNAAGAYGFVHSSEEVLQQVEYVRGERTFPAEVLPLLFRAQADLAGEEAGRAAAPWQPSDVYIVEISSMKSCRLHGVAVQSNYLSRHFADFFASAQRAQTFWLLAREDLPGDTAAFLESDPVFRLLSPEDQALLSALTLHVQTFDEVFADMARVVELLGRERVLFVTHVNATSADGAVIPSRDRLIRWVKQAAHKLEVPCFDPTALMRAFGQERAMERGGLDLAHYTNAFADRWYSHVHGEYLLPRIAEQGFEAGGGEPGEQALVAESIGAALADDFFDGSRQLFAALAQQPDNRQLRVLQGQVLARIGDYHGAMAALDDLVDAPEMTTDGLVALMRSRVALGDPRGAFDVATRLIAEEYEDRDIYSQASLAAAQLGLHAEAARYGKLAFRLDPTQHAAAIRVLDHYTATDDVERLGNWRGQVMAVLEEVGDVGLARALGEWALARRDKDLIVQALAVIAASDMPSVQGLIEDCARDGMQDAAAEAIVAVAAMPHVTEKVLKSFRAIAREWADAGAALLAQGRDCEAYALTTAAQAVLPRNSVAIRVERSVADALRSDVRAAKARGDLDAVIARCEEAGVIVYRRAEVARTYATALLEAGRTAEARDVARRVHELAPDDIDAHALYAQVAATLDDFTLALRLYGTLARRAGDRVERFRSRIDRFLLVAGRRGPGRMRQLAADGAFQAALDLGDLLTEHTDAGERVAQEAHRVRSALRLRLRQLDEDEDVGREALHVLQLMLRIAPDDASALRRAALEAMKLQDFALAIQYWNELERVSPGLESTGRNLNRCKVLLERQSRMTQSGRVRAALVA